MTDSCIEVSQDGVLPESAPSISRCSICGSALPPERVTARPTAGQCVPCLVAAGDVRLIRRYDECIGEAYVETYFLSNSTIDGMIRRTGRHTPSSKVLAEVTDSPLVESKQPEREAMRRADSTPFRIIESQENYASA